MTKLEQPGSVASEGLRRALHRLTCPPTHTEESRATKTRKMLRSIDSIVSLLEAAAAMYRGLMFRRVAGFD